MSVIEFVLDDQLTEGMHDVGHPVRGQAEGGAHAEAFTPKPRAFVDGLNEVLGKPTPPDPGRRLRAVA
jgi:hypothetical protein